MNQQNVAVDQGTQPPQAVGADGKPAEKTWDLHLTKVTPAEARRLARAAAAMGDQSTADQITAKLGESKVKSTIIERHPYMIGLGSGLLIAGVVYGTVRGVKYYRRRSAEKAAMSGGKVVKLPATGTK